jgi:hypothetical protein
MIMTDSSAGPYNGKKITYEKPLFEEQAGLVFPRQIMEAYNGGRFCVQCSGCHGCR